MAFKWFKREKKSIHTDDKQAAGDALKAAQVPGFGESSEKPSSDGSDERQTVEDISDDVPGDTEMKKEPGGFFNRLKKGLSKTRRILTTDIDDLFAGGRQLDGDLIEELEELLITADVGVRTTANLLERIAKRGSIATADEFKAALKEEMLAIIDQPAPATGVPAIGPKVVMVVGVNGVGKTTTIGKLAAKAVADGQKVIIGAADTFRAAAIEQLDIWANRAGAEIVKHKDNADPASVAYDSVEAAVARKADLVLIDTAGRLHTKVNLMEELKKIHRTIGKVLPEAPHEVLLVLDATTGQNALSQAEMFNQAIGITGIALTKLDGTARGGIAVAICDSLNLPLKYIGIGESIDDLQEFNPGQFVDALI
ncbi:MAG: signal recognition particle-docking protein FtsY [Desulfobacterales bacterium]|nr:signal recognition particle-docking protein FtsY [Desulfobacterales bacterium]